MLFHLTPRNQGRTFASVSRVVRPGAPFLFTGAEVPTVDNDSITGTMNGVAFRYGAVASYRPLLEAHDLELVSIYDDPGVSTYYFARRRL